MSVHGSSNTRITNDRRSLPATATAPYTHMASTDGIGFSSNNVPSLRKRTLHTSSFTASPYDHVRSSRRRVTDHVSYRVACYLIYRYTEFSLRTSELRNCLLIDFLKLKC
jgi:hypothetical protein